MGCHTFTHNIIDATGQCFVNFGSCEAKRNYSCVDKFVTYFNMNINSHYNLRNCTECPDFPPPNPDCPDNSMFPQYATPREARKIWEDWDLPVLALYILFTQLYLHVFGRHGRKSANRRGVINLNVWLLYLLADLVATIALGKLSKVKKDVNRHVDPSSLVRGIWAPIILFYLGGPDTITVLAFEENQMWLRHLVGLLTQGLRTSYVLYATWAKDSWHSVFALGMLIPGIIKYSERVWVIWTGAPTISLDQDKNNNNSNARSFCSPNEPIIEAYSCFQTLKPHITSYRCDGRRLRILVEKFQKWARSTSSGDDSNLNGFKLIEIELGFMYDVLFSKLGMIFTVWGCILRFISFSCIVCVLVGFFLVEKPSLLRPDERRDHFITIVLLLGAILLEIGGVLVQLGSDWAVVWAFKHPTAPLKVSTIILCLHKLVIRKSRKRWAGLMGQFSLIDCGKKYEPTMCNEMMSSICGRVRMLKRKFSLPSSPVTDDVKKLIIDQLSERLQNVDGKEVKIPRTFSAMTRGETALEECGELEALKWSVEFGFAQSLIIWHIATEVCYHSEDPKPEVMEPTRILSNYMMHLLLICPSTFPISNIDVDLLNVRNGVKVIFNGKGAEACDLLVGKENSRAQELARNLKANDNRWTIMSKVWVEMLCYAASRCSLKHHAKELRHGGEFITHVWLLLQHFGVRENLDESWSAGGEIDITEKAQEVCSSAPETLEICSCLG